MKRLTSKKLKAEFMQTKFYLEKAHREQDVDTAFRMNARLIGQAQVLLGARNKSFEEFYEEVRHLRHVNLKKMYNAPTVLAEAKHKLIENTLQEILVQLK